MLTCPTVVDRPLRTPRRSRMNAHASDPALRRFHNWALGDYRGQVSCRGTLIRVITLAFARAGRMAAPPGPHGWRSPEFEILTDQ